jgi:hypothetical protein
MNYKNFAKKVTNFEKCPYLPTTCSEKMEVLVSQICHMFRRLLGPFSDSSFTSKKQSDMKKERDEEKLEEL